MTKYVKITLGKRGVSCRARLLEDEAPLTCGAVWEALPLAGGAVHGTYARHDIYTRIRPFAQDEPPLEWPTVTPIAGDVCYWALPASSFADSYRQDRGTTDVDHVVQLSIFYERNNLLLNPDFGFVPNTVFATIEDNLEEMATACLDVWRNGWNGESLAFSRAD
jgi:hypothetical protein